MTDQGIPVDLANPGQVFACLGFLEAAHVLSGRAEGGFSWSGDGATFHIENRDATNAFATVLDFLSRASIHELTPLKQHGADAVSAAAVFPAEAPEERALPVRLEMGNHCIDVAHWCDGSTRNKFKLYAGFRSAAHVVRAMLCGVPADRGKAAGPDFEYKGLRSLWAENKAALTTNPFNVLTPLGGTFNFDPRKNWTGLEAGYSPNTQGHGVASSPVVEILAAIGLSHARPAQKELSRDVVEYAAWEGLVPPSLARPALATSPVGLKTRRFRFTLARPNPNSSATTFAQEMSA